MTTDTTTEFATILAELSDPTGMVDEHTRHDHNPFSLATLADCYSPDSADSPGARFLAGIARDVAEHIGDQSLGWSDQLGGLTDAAHEIADSAVPIYTHERWATFVDLGAYDEDTSEYAAGEDASDLTMLAGVALYAIAERLVRALAEELTEALDADDPFDPEHDDWREATEAEAAAYHSGHWTPGLAFREGAEGVECREA